MASTKNNPKLNLVRAPFKNELIDHTQLNDQQKQVIAHRGSPLLVLGEAGSGKTTTLITAVSKRISEGQDPNSILVITYGRHSASRLRDQIASANPASHTVSEPIARTFHSIAFLILNDQLTNTDSSKYVLLSGAEQDAQIRELLAIDAANPAATLWPKELIPALTTRGFAKELRDFIGRATERGSSPAELIKYADKYEQKYWPAICEFWQRYRQSLALRDVTTSASVNRIDPSEIIIAAAEKLEGNQNLLDKYKKLFQTIYVDEFQESDRAQRRLLQLLSGQELVIFADPQSAVGRFRGADPDNLLSDLEQSGIKNIIKLPVSFRIIKDQQVAMLSSASDEANYIAHQFRSAHLRQGVPWSQMAVILRSPGAQVSALQRAFAMNSIPVEIDAVALSLADNPAIKPIITLAQIAIGQLKLIPSNWDQIEELLKSEIAGADAISIRQMRISLSKEQKGDLTKSSTELIFDALTSPTADLPWEQLTPLKRINDLLKEVKKVSSKSQDISDLLWSIWSNAKNYEGDLISSAWQQQALAGGNRGAIADQNLDALITLFEVARRFSERLPGAKAELFIDQLLGEKILSDSITASAQRGEVVQVMTVHSAKGLQWRYVALAGMQEGSWPNLKQRGSLLGSERLVEIFRHGISNPAQLDAISASGLAEDEKRLLNVAATRATEKLIITAVSQEDNQPSRYFEKFAPGEIEITQTARAITQPALVADLRRLASRASNKEEAVFAQRMLKTLAVNGVQRAEPKNWVGNTPISTDLPVIKSDEVLRISPSSLESFTECSLKWLLEQSGGKDADSTAQVLGTAIHVIAAQLLEQPSLSLDQLEDKLKGAWSLIDMNKGWIKDYEYRRAAAMLEKFYSWNLKNKNTLVGVEERFEFKLGNAVVSGSIDRIELTAENKYYIVDLKTGATAISYDKALENKQLQSYQLAVVNDGFKEKLEHQEVAGAELVFVGDHNAKDAKPRPQEEVKVDEVTAELTQIAQGMSDKSFVATINERCRTCAVKSSCPIQIQGQAVIGK
ncbi:MAG: AAA family ATPase [Actinobacteria bacterium]|uniref:DNA 3'-5' helicase n=1 Tax=freshwater metagenome TaxID=449393 RepID=A0A6J7UB91_9ZZZZ|nr:AAA family ATPase [Actinomycetota bacterium]